MQNNLDNKLKFGLGGHLEWNPDTSFEERMAEIVEELSEIDPQAHFDYLDGIPTQDRDADLAVGYGYPYLSFLDLFIIGGSESWPDAIETIKKCVDTAKRVGTYKRLDMQIHGDSFNPSLTDLIEFFRRAWDLTDPLGIELCVETHIDRISYDPRHLMRVHEALLDATKGERGLNIAADFSHYVHQIGNSHGILWDDHQSGALNLDPFDSENYISKMLIPSGLIKMGHLRMAVPNNLNREQGSIQYPIVDPSLDSRSKEYTGLRHWDSWTEERTMAWKKWYTELFRQILTSEGEETVYFSSEFIRYDGDYALEPYRNRFQNLAVIAWAQKTKRDLITELKHLNF
jgi:hypothetical protein